MFDPNTRGMNGDIMDLSSRIKQLREERGLTQIELAKILKISNTTLSQYETGARVPSDDIKAALADYFSVSLDFLFGRTNQRTKSVESPKGVRIPVLGDVAAGLPIEAVENIVDYEEIDQAMAASGEHFGLRLKDDSMEPRMKDGDVVIVRKQEDVKSGDVAVVLVNGDSATVKRIKKGPSGITLIPNNPVYDPMFYSSDEIEQLPVRILGKVVELRGKL